MMENYVTLSIETHLFFARIMKEHALFLEAGFPCKETQWIQRADRLRNEFENLLRQVIQFNCGLMNHEILKSQELVTQFTLQAERRTSQLTGISIDHRITMAEQQLEADCSGNRHKRMIRSIDQLNRKAIHLLDELIGFKESILREVEEGCLFTFNYPLLIQHILREAKLYRSILTDLVEDQRVSYKKIRNQEMFWNQIMMEHAWFIRGLLDPTETELIESADHFAVEYGELLEMARTQNCKAMDGIRRKSLEETLKYRKFKEAGAEGILNCEIASLILPLLADHVLREANHYIRILECGMERTY
ncbi:MAG: DUF2935 domain-containing protein [Lachnospiraceae bacterium]|nr:DUF2935 domain-containing protein [Lachnospiraceae bacterium]MDY4206967.1 DUF2935 domain-containing protein [Lachnospiraceae bacterium]